MTPTLPLLAANVARTWPETVGQRDRNSINTGKAISEAGGLAMLVAHLVAGGECDLPRAQASKEIGAYLQLLGIPQERFVRWVKTLLMGPDVLAETSACPVHNAAFGFDLHPYQHEGARWSAARSGSILAFGCGVGKAQPVDEPVLTPQGWRPIGDLAVGDEVIGSQGRPVRVTGVFPQGVREVATVYVDEDGSYTRCDWDHLWAVRGADSSEFRVLSLRHISLLSEPLWIPGFAGAPSRWLRGMVDGGPARCVCIQVDAPDHLYVTRNYIVTHNTAVAVSAAIGAVNLGDCSRSRCYIIAPVNAHGVWYKARKDLERVFEKVVVYSGDSAHHLTNLDTSLGGALIVDEAHRAKGSEARRTKALLKVRAAFDWGVCLTGSMLESGPSGLISLHEAACPGLSRFTSEETFGHNFDCVARKRVGHRVLRKLVIPSDRGRELLVPYLAKSTRSLSFTSPEVAAVVHIKDHTDLVEDTWERPDWAPEDNPDILWLPATQWKTYAGALAVCMMRENRPIILDHCRRWNIPVNGDQDDEDWQAIHDALKKLKDDPFFPVEEQDTLKFALMNCGLPTFPRIFNAMIREGRFNYAIERFTLSEKPKRQAYRRLWGPDEFGPKVQYVDRWLTDNKDEPLVLGAGGRQTVAVLSRLLDARGIPYRTIQGGVSPEDRAAFVEEFQSGNVRVMLLQQVAGSEAVTLTKAATSMLVDHDLKATAYTQYIHRTWRQGQERETTHIDMVFGDLQQQVLTTIHRGRSFDQRTREALEAEFYAG